MKYRKYVASLFTVCVLFLCAASPGYSEVEGLQLSVLVDGKEINQDGSSFMDPDYIGYMVPAAAVARLLGASVTWDEKHHALLINTPAYPGNTPASSRTAVIVDGVPLDSQLPVKNVSGHIYAPADKLAAALHATAAWTESSNTLKIISDKAAQEFVDEQSGIDDVFHGIGMTPHIASDGTKEFDLTAVPHEWEPLKGIVTTAWTFNGQVPGPLIRITEGDHVRIKFHNMLPEPSTIHWHGLEIANSMDGVPFMTQDPVLSGDTFTYDFIAPHPGTYIYHSHYDDFVQESKGMYGPLIVDPKQPDKNDMYDHEYVMVLSGFHENTTLDQEEDYYTINGRSYPDTQPIKMLLGETVRIRLINIDTTEFHTMHLHGMDFTLIAKNGSPLNEPQKMNTVELGPAETADIAFTATNPGMWMFHCHVIDHTKNGGRLMDTDMGGLATVVEVVDPSGKITQSEDQMMTQDDQMMQ